LKDGFIFIIINYKLLLKYLTLVVPQYSGFSILLSSHDKVGIFL